MKQHTKWFAITIALASGLAIVSSAVADTVISTFDDFNLDGLFAWSDATIVSGPTSYQITDSGYGSGFKNITSQSYNPDTHEFTLTWTSSPGTTYTIWHTLDLSNALEPLVTRIASEGSQTTTTVVLPTANAGFVRIQKE